MTAIHSVVVLADYIMKGVGGFNASHAVDVSVAACLALDRACLPPPRPHAQRVIVLCVMWHLRACVYTHVLHVDGWVGG